MTITNNPSEIISNVINSFKSLTVAINNLKQYLLTFDKNFYVWFQNPSGLTQTKNLNPRNQIFKFISQLEYLDWQDPKSILVGPGVVYACQDTIKAVEQINNCKLTFKKSILSLKSSNISIKDESLNEQFNNLLNDQLKDQNINKNNRNQNTANILKKIGLARLHLKQCYRLIPILPTQPIKVSFTFAHIKAITKINKEQAQQLLLKRKQDQGILTQLQKLNSIPSSEPLAIVQTLAPHLRANIVYSQSDNQGIIRKMIKGSMPIFYLGDTKSELPVIIPPKTEKTETQNQNSNKPNRLIRSDTKLDPNPFLPAIRVFRYKEADLTHR